MKSLRGHLGVTVTSRLGEVVTPRAGATNYWLVLGSQTRVKPGCLGNQAVLEFKKASKTEQPID